MATVPKGKVKMIIAPSSKHIPHELYSTSNKRCNTKAVALAANHAFSAPVLHSKRIIPNTYARTAPLLLVKFIRRRS